MYKKYNIAMVGPELNGLGGISRVVRILYNSGLFNQKKIRYIASVKSESLNDIFFLLGALMQFYFSLISGCSLVYIHTSSYKSFYRKSFFILISLFLKKKIILHIHPTHFHKFIAESKGIKRVYIFLLLKRIACFIVLTEEMKKKIQSLLPEQIVFVMNNPVDTGRMILNENIEREKDLLLYLGWYIKEKGVYELVDAIELLVKKGIKVHLNFYGTKQIKKLQEYVRKKNLDKEIAVNDWIDDREKLRILYKSAMLVLPSHSEGIPNVILEAMATKTPIISTLVGGLKEILRDGENAVIVKVNDPNDLCNKIRRCSEDKELRNRIALTAYEEVVKKYDVQYIKAKLCHILKSEY